MRIHKVYTRLGDDGTTSLIGGDRVRKESLRIESFGTVDELQATLGLLRAALAESRKKPELCREMVGHLHRVQNDLFDLGSILSTPERHRDEIKKPITDERVTWLEETMDVWNRELPPLPSFVLSGGGTFSALSHVARTVCRRCERATLRLAREEWVPAEALKYLNRLSDFLFVLGRHLAKVFGEEEPLWETPLG